MAKSNLTMAYQIAQSGRHSAERLTVQVTGWVVEFPGADTLTAWWRRPLRHQRGRWPGTRPAHGFCQPPI